MRSDLNSINLRDILARLYPQEPDSRRVAQDAGLKIGQIPFSPKAVLNWHEILLEAERENRVKFVMQVALREYGDNAELLRAVQYHRARESAFSEDLRERLTLLASSLELTDEALGQFYTVSLPASFLLDKHPILGSVIRQLSDIPPQSDGTLVILGFTESLARYADRLGRASVAVALRAWIASAAKAAGIESYRAEQVTVLDATMEELDPSKDAYLIVELRPDLRTPTDFHLRRYLLSILFWKRSDDAEYWYDDDAVSVPLRDVPEQVARALREHVGVLIREGFSLSIEFLVPYELVSQAMDQWDRPDSRIRGRRFGMDHPLVVRSLDRIDDQMLWPRWRRQWQRFQETSITNGSEQVFWICDPGSCRPLDLYLALTGTGAADHTACLGLTFPLNGQSREEIFWALLEAGTPVAIWPRASQAVPTEAAECRSRIASTLAASTLRELPKRLQAVRQDAGHNVEHLGNHLTLLWDDFDRIPPKYLMPLMTP